MCAEYHAQYYRRNFSFDKEWKITIPTIHGIKEPGQPYHGVEKKELINHLQQVMKGNQFMFLKIHGLIKEIRNS